MRDPYRSEKLKTSAAFEQTRKCSTLFKAINAMATAIYRMAKQSGQKMDYLKHGEIVKKLYKHFYTTPDALPKRISYEEIQRTLKGFCFAKERDARSVPCMSQIDGNSLYIRLKAGVSDAILLIGQGVVSEFSEGDYITENTMQQIEEVENINGKIRIPYSTNNLVMLQYGGLIWVV